MKKEARDALTVTADNGLSPEGPALALEHQSTWSISDETDHPMDSLLMLTGYIKRDSCVPVTCP